MKFDNIVMNPPYQDTHIDGNRKQLSHNLYSKFIVLSIDLLNKDGFLGGISPPGWMAPIAATAGKKDKNKFKLIFRDYNVLTLNINEKNSCFDVGSDITYFVIQNNKNKSKTNITCKYKNKIYNSYTSLPNFLYYPMLLTKQSIHILQNVVFNNITMFNVQNSNQFHPVVIKNKKHIILQNTKDNIAKYPLFHTNAKTKYSNTKALNQYTKKVIFTKSGYLIPTYDDGEMGTTDAGFWIEVENKAQGDSLISILTSELYTFLVTINKWSGFNMPAVVQRLPKLALNKKYNNSDIYKALNIDKNSIKYIKKVNTL